MNPWTSHYPMRAALASIVSDVLSSIEGRKRSPKGLPEVVDGFWVVALGLRCGYLLETVQLEEDQCTQLTKRFGDHPLLGQLSVLYENTTTSAFAINTDCFLKRMGAPLSPDLEDGSKLQIHVPEDMAEMWVDVTSPVPRGRFADLPDHALQFVMDVGEQVMCPHTEHIRLTLERDEQFVDVAGGLLEYPIIYFFDPDADTERVNLDGAPLVLVQTWISFQGEKMYNLLSFTYPTALREVEDHIPFLDNLPDRLVRQYSKRLRKAIEAGHLIDNLRELKVEVTLETVVLDRVVL